MVEAFDSLVDSGNAKMVQLAVAGLKAEYEKSNGFEGDANWSCTYTTSRCLP